MSLCWTTAVYLLMCKFVDKKNRIHCKLILVERKEATHCKIWMRHIRVQPSSTEDLYSQCSFKVGTQK